MSAITDWITQELARKKAEKAGNSSPVASAAAPVKSSNPTLDWIRQELARKKAMQQQPTIQQTNPGLLNLPIVNPGQIQQPVSNNPAIYHLPIVNTQSNFQPVQQQQQAPQLTKGYGGGTGYWGNNPLGAQSLYQQQKQKTNFLGQSYPYWRTTK